MDNKIEVRKPNGQFGKGNQTGGRKRRAAEEEAMALFQRIVSIKDRIAIIEKAIAKAKNGDDRARKFLFDYLYGPPVEHREVDFPSGFVVKWDDGDSN